MGNCTRGYVVTPIKDVSHVMAIVERVITNLIAEAKPDRKGRVLPEGFSHPDTYLTPASESAHTQFAIAGEKRTLNVYFACDSDPNHKYPGDKVIFDMGLGGLSEKVVSGVLARMTHLGRCYLDVDDCDGPTPDVEITAHPMTFMDAVVSRYASAMAVKSWIRMHPLLPSAPALHDFLGITPTELATYNAEGSMYDICDLYRAKSKGESAVAE
jgi:hypothetical protein